MIMKRNILIAALCLVAVGMQAQVIIKHNGEKVEFGTNELVKMVFNSYGNNDNNGDNIRFVRQAGDTLTFDIDEIYVMGFAEDFTRIDEVKQAGQAAIVYDAKGHTVYVVNAEVGTISIFTADGRRVKSAQGTSVSVADLAYGLYVVSYNEKLNAKIVKK
jgi:DNA-binding beta-propeller fold protein YncE